MQLLDLEPLSYKDVESIFDVSWTDWSKLTESIAFNDSDMMDNFWNSGNFANPLDGLTSKDVCPTVDELESEKQIVEALSFGPNDLESTDGEVSYRSGAHRLSLTILGSSPTQTRHRLELNN